ncbi:MAG: 2-oxo acid dehydrogenase subunit E2 [Spongiibacteraceae bacterium]
MSNDIKAISMPKWGMEMSEGVVGDWHVNVGDNVSAGDDLVDIETSKIVNTVTASESGVLRLIIGKTGDTLDVGAILGVLADAQTSDAEIQAFANGLSKQGITEDVQESKAAAAEITSTEPVHQTAATSELKSTPAATSTDTSNSLSSLAAGDDDSQLHASPIARRLAKQYGVNLHNINGTGRYGRISKHDLETAVSNAGGSLIAQQAPRSQPQRIRDDSAVKATPVARRMAKDLGINLNDCRNSGNRGRVCKADVEALASLSNKQTAPEPTTVAAPVENPLTSQAMSGMRKTIAERLQSSKQTAPHFRVQIDANIDALLTVRKQINAANTQAKVSVNDFIVKACATALAQFPAVNVQFDGQTIKQFKHADISVAVAIDEGLITPIVKSSDTKGLIEISNEVRDLATRAKLGRLKPEEFQGGTFCVSNLGMFGIKQFDAIINPPQGAILAVGAGEQKAIVTNGSIVIATVLTLTLSSDHRIIDGATAAQFMSTLKGFIEQPATMLG